MSLTPYDLMLGHPPDDALPDRFVDHLHEIEDQCKGRLTSGRVTGGHGEPCVYWSAEFRSTGWDQREAVAEELERLARLLRRIK